jgi:hypothetical protein
MVRPDWRRDASGRAPASVTAPWNKVVAAQGESLLPVYDNMFYRQKPNMEQEGFVASNILYEGDIWPHGQNYGGLPSRNTFEATVRAHSANPGPLEQSKASGRVSGNRFGCPLASSRINFA